MTATCRNRPVTAGMPPGRCLRAEPSPAPGPASGPSPSTESRSHCQAGQCPARAGGTSPACAGSRVLPTVSDSPAEAVLSRHAGGLIISQDARPGAGRRAGIIMMMIRPGHPAASAAGNRRRLGVEHDFRVKILNFRLLAATSPAEIVTGVRRPPAGGRPGARAWDGASKEDPDQVCRSGTWTHHSESGPGPCRPP